MNAPLVSRSATMAWVAAAVVVAGLAGCAGVGPSATSSYRCEQGFEFSVRFIDDTALVDGARGHDLLLRDAGGQGPLQTVYSNPRMRAEFGLGSGGREAVLRYPSLPLVLHCVRD